MTEGYRMGEAFCPGRSITPPEGMLCMGESRTTWPLCGAVFQCWVMARVGACGLPCVGMYLTGVMETEHWWLGWHSCLGCLLFRDLSLELEDKKPAELGIAASVLFCCFLWFSVLSSWLQFTSLDNHSFYFWLSFKVADTILTRNA